MEFEELENKIDRAIKCLYKDDSFLIKNNLNERTITYRLAVYLQLEFPEYHVDCEYNRMVGGNMNQEYITKKLELHIEEIKSDDTGAKSVFPDIIIHLRGNDKNNLLVIEVKKNYSNENNVSYDYKKLKAYTKNLNYKLGLFIKFSASQYFIKNNGQWFHGGEIVEREKLLNNNEI